MKAFMDKEFMLQSHIVLLGKTLGGKRDGIADIGSLSLNQTRCNILHKTRFARYGALWRSPGDQLLFYGFF